MADHATDQLQEAFGRPGIPPRWTSSSKSGVGTAYSTSSRVWFTISHGILNEIYFPTIDHPQTRDMQFLITDGETFFHEERRDLDNEIECVESNALGYRVTTSDRNGRYRLVKQIISDPHQPCVLINVQVEGDAEFLKKLRIYAQLAPHLEVGGYGNSARRFKTAGQNVLVAWKAGKLLAMGANVGFNKTSCGYIGHSDGWQDLHKDFRLDWEFEKAEDGNVAVIGQINLTWSNDEWVKASDTSSTSTGLGIEFVDIAINDNQTSPVKFTFLWTGRDRWEGHNYKVRIKQKRARVLAA
ncbi:MAG TPA: hypothetical protein VJP02_15585 [Candidatus Sulfotelmatobacter sp.]|nr:hypothetical protein [Candidatus Sulfotelmatobacter sp.]